MKPYGLPRDKDIECPDKADIRQYGLKSSTGRLKTKSGEYKSYTRSTENRNKTRLYFKRKERALGKELCNETHN
jgi:hypothetical protein